MFGLGGLVPPILNLGNRWECPASHYGHFTTASKVRLGDLHFQSGGFVEEKSMLSVLGIEMQSFGRPPCNLVSALTD